MKLPTKEQWNEMAEAFDTPLDKRTRKYLALTNPFGLTDPEGRTGICSAIGSGLGLGCSGDFFQAFSFESPYGINWWPTTDAGDRQRAFFCCMMSAITEAGDMEAMIGEV